MRTDSACAGPAGVSLMDETNNPDEESKPHSEKPAIRLVFLNEWCPDSDKNVGNVFEQRLRWPRRGESHGRDE